MNTYIVSSSIVKSRKPDLGTGARLTHPSVSDADRVPIRHQPLGLAALIYVCRDFACVVQPEPVSTEAVEGRRKHGVVSQY